MQVELRNIRTMPLASVTSHCFQATVVVNGEVIGKVKNDGRGANTYHPPSVTEVVNETDIEAMIKEVISRSEPKCLDRSSLD